MQLGFSKTFDRTNKQFRPVAVTNDRRFSHTWVIGKSGTGKSTALLRWMIDDIHADQGLALFDLHGDLADDLLMHIPRRRREDTILFDPTAFAIGFNPFDTVPEERRSFVASSLVDTFKSVWGYADIATPVLDQFLYNGARALMDYPGGTLFELKHLLTSEPFRTRVLRSLRDPIVQDFWEQDFSEHMPEREQRERTLSTLNKIGALIADPFIRHTIGQKRLRLNLLEVMAEGKILVVRLPQGKLGLEKASLLASLVLSQLHVTALSREAGERRPFHLYLDECHLFAPSTLIEMVSGIRKFGVSLVLANQYLTQLDPKLRDALIGTTGTLIAFRLGPNDARTLEPEFNIKPGDVSLVEIDPFTAYSRQGLTTRLLTMPIGTHPVYPTSPAKIRNATRARFAIGREQLEHKLTRFVRNQASRR